MDSVRGEVVMVTVQDIMTDPIFEGFRIIAGKRGLYNKVSGTAIFDWEEPQDVGETFAPGEFVITTLSEAKNRPEDLLRRIKALIDIRVSAICIKTLFFKSVPKEIKDIANSNDVPVFLFEDTYVDDIIYAVRNAIQGESNADHVVEQVEELLWDEYSAPEKSSKLIRRISPVLYEDYVCIYISPRYQKDKRTGDLINDQFEKTTQYFLDGRIDYEQGFCTSVKLRGAILILCSMKQAEGKKEIDELVNRIIMELDLKHRFITGISNIHSKYDEFEHALKESMYAGISAMVDREATMKYCELGVDSMLIPVWDNNWIRTAYETEIEKLQDYDRKHNAKLFETLLVFTESEGSVSLTAMKLLQHENTVRHRLERIRMVIGAAEQEDSYVHMYVIARLYRILQVMMN